MIIVLKYFSLILHLHLRILAFTHLLLQIKINILIIKLIRIVKANQDEDS